MLWERQCRHLGELVRYADDAVVLCRSRADAEESLRRLGLIMDRLSLKLHPDKTRIVELGLGKQGFVFLGCYLRIVLSHFKGREYLFRWPSPRAMNRIRARIRELTDRRRWAGLKDIRQVDRCPQSRPAGLGQLLPHGERLLEVPAGGSLRERSGWSGCCATCEAGAVGPSPCASGPPHASRTTSVSTDSSGRSAIQAW